MFLIYLKTDYVIKKIITVTCVMCVQNDFLDSKFKKDKKLLTKYQFFSKNCPEFHVFTKIRTLKVWNLVDQLFLPYRSLEETFEKCSFFNFVVSD